MGLGSYEEVGLHGVKVILVGWPVCGGQDRAQYEEYK